MGWRWACKGGFLHNELDDVRLEKTMETMKNRRKIGISDHFSKKSFFGQQILGGGGEGNGGIQRRRWRGRRRRRCHHSGTTKQGKIVLLSQCMDMDHGKLR